MKTPGCTMWNQGLWRFQPPHDGEGPPSPDCDVFIWSIPHQVFGDELLPLFQSAGQVYDMWYVRRFWMRRRGYALVTYTDQEAAHCAVAIFHRHTLERHRIRVAMGLDKHCLLIKGLPRETRRQDLMEELQKVTPGVQHLLVYQNEMLKDLTRNNAFAFVDYESHRAAVGALKKLLAEPFSLWHQVVVVRWAFPSNSRDEELKFLLQLEEDRVRPVTLQGAEIAAGFLNSGEPRQPQPHPRSIGGHFIPPHSQDQSSVGITVDGGTRHLAVNYCGALQVSQSLMEEHQGRNMRSTRTATFLLELWSAQRGLPAPSYLPFAVKHPDGRCLLGYTVTVSGLYGGTFRILDRTRERAAQIVFNRICCGRFDGN